jgi:hypothetical protein
LIETRSIAALKETDIALRDRLLVGSQCQLMSPDDADGAVTEAELREFARRQLEAWWPEEDADE